MATKKSAKDKALEDIAAMDKTAPEKKDKASREPTKPPAEDPKEKEEVKTPADYQHEIPKELQKEMERVIDAGFDPDDEDAPEPPETEKVKIITTKNIPAEQRFKVASPVVKATKTRMITTKNMKEFSKNI